MFIEADYSQALASIEPERVLLALEIVPQSYPVADNSPYRPEYDWLFTVERQVARLVEPWMKQYRYELIGNTGVLCEVLSNAYCHGHSKRTDLPIFLNVHLGKKGILMSVEDNGPGFNVEKIQELAARGKQYFLIAGNGICRLANSENFRISYDKQGRRCNLLHLFADHEDKKQQ